MKQLYNIPATGPCLHRKAKSCQLMNQGLPPSTEGASGKASISNLTSLTRSPDLKSVKNEPSEVYDDEEEAKVKRPPTLEKLTVMIQNFLDPLTPAQDSLVGKQYQKRMGMQKSFSVPGRDADPTEEYRDNKSIFSHKSFYLTT